MLTRRKESDAYLTNVYRYRWSRQITMKVDVIEAFSQHSDFHQLQRQTHQSVSRCHQGGNGKYQRSSLQIVITAVQKAINDCGREDIVLITNHPPTGWMIVNLTCACVARVTELLFLYCIMCLNIFSAFTFIQCLCGLRVCFIFIRRNNQMIT